MLGHILLILGLGLTSGSPTTRPADGPAPAGSQVPSDPVFSALLIDGTQVSGQLRRLSEVDGLTLLTASGLEQSVRVDRLVKLVRDGTPPPAATEGNDLVLFPDGDRLAHCKVGATAEFTLAVHSSTLDTLAIPLDSLLGLIFDASSESTSLDSLIARVRTDPRDAELLWLANGDKLPGLFSGLDDQKLTFQPATGKVELPRRGLRALGFDPGQVVYRRPDGPYFELSLGDGSRLGVNRVQFERGQVVATTRFNSTIHLPIGQLSELHVINSSVAYLSDRETSGTIYEPYIGPTRPYRRNATVADGPLRLGGRTYERGLGTQSRTLLVYKLEPGSKQFQALIGVDDRAGPLGNVVFKVQGDKKTLYTSSPMVAGEPPRAINLDLNGVGFLILITEFGDRGDVQDHADWVEARITR